MTINTLGICSPNYIFNEKNLKFHDWLLMIIHNSNKPYFVPLTQQIKMHG